MQERLYFILHDMLRRCYDNKHESYKHYGQIGITICDEWKLVLNKHRDKGLMEINKQKLKNFKEWAFANGYDSKLTIDRIDYDGNYCPENCKWSTYREQNLHLRKIKTASSKYLGVSLDKSRNLWSVKIRIYKKMKFLGRFSNEEEAAQCYNNYIIEHSLPNVLNVI